MNAMVETGICNNFLIMHTADEAATASYLRYLTEQLISSMQQVLSIRYFWLSIVSGDDSGLQRTIVRNMTLEHFSQRVSKSKSLTLRDIFAKQLIQIKGMRSLLLSVKLALSDLMNAQVYRLKRRTRSQAFIQLFRPSSLSIAAWLPTKCEILHPCLFFSLKNLILTLSSLTASGAREDAERYRGRSEQNQAGTFPQ
jgi:hypothetical protein